jgi:hypothetical protein
MRKTIFTRLLLWILVQLVAAVTGGPVEEVKHWTEYGETRLRKALTHEVNRNQLKLSNSYGDGSRNVGFVL